MSTIKLLPFHKLATMFPPMSDDEFFGLVKDIEKNGQRQDIDIWNGEIIEGVHRAKACQQLGIEPRYHERRFESEEGARAYVISLNIQRRHLSAEQKREMIAKLADWSRSDRAIADEFKTNRNTAGRVRKEVEKKSGVTVVTPEKRIGKDGKKQLAKKPTKPQEQKPLVSAPEAMTKKEAARVTEQPRFTTAKRLMSEWLVANEEQKSEFINSVGLVKFYDLASEAQRAQLEAHLPTMRWKKEKGLGGVKKTIDGTASKALPAPAK
jgi:ParB-like chromosome segregation protein Spo0J